MKHRQSKQALMFAFMIASACASGEKTQANTSSANDADASSGDGDRTSHGDGDVGGDGDGSGDGSDDGSDQPGDGDGPDQPGDGDSSSGHTGLAAVDCTGDAPAKPEDLVTDFEDGTVGVNPVEGRGGGFYIFNDKMNDETAQPFMVKAMNRCSDSSSIYAFCTHGSGFTVWGAGFGTDLGVVDAMTMSKSAVDLSMYKGISFWIGANAGSSAPAVKVMLADGNTAPEGGKCTTDGAAEATEKCDPFVKNVPLQSKWTKVQVSFDSLRQGGWGKKVDAFAKDAVYGIQLQFAAGTSFDVCFDQLVLTR
jgi:hypothetical protein